MAYSPWLSLIELIIEKILPLASLLPQTYISFGYDDTLPIVPTVGTKTGGLCI